MMGPGYAIARFFKSLKNKRMWKISAYFLVFFEYKRMRLFLSVYSIAFISVSKSTPLAVTGPHGQLASLKSLKPCLLQSLVDIMHNSPVKQEIFTRRKSWELHISLRILLYMKPKNSCLLHHRLHSDSISWAIILSGSDLGQISPLMWTAPLVKSACR